jgi:hypothetical protein
MKTKSPEHQQQNIQNLPKCSQDRLFLSLQKGRTRDREEEVTMNPNSRNPKTTMLTPLPEISLESF